MVATPNTTPTLDELIALVARGDRSAEAGPIPAQVTAYDSASQTCDAQPLVLLPIDGELKAAPIVRQAQVLWPSGATWSLVGPMAVGDLVWLLPAGADIGQWKASNAAQSPAATLRRGSLSDVVALPGSRPLTSPLDSTAFDAAALVIKAALLKLGDSTATDFVALASLVLSAFQDLWAEVAAHGHPTPSGHTSGYTSGGTLPVPPLPWAPDLAAEKVMAK